LTFLRKKIFLSTVILISVFLFLKLGRTSNYTQKTLQKTEKDSLNPIPREKGVVVKEYPSSEVAKVTHKIDSLLKRIHKRYDFHGAVLVAKHGKIVYNNQIGYANFRNKKLLHENSAFQIASVSKQFTAASILLLYERELLQLTDSVTKYFPDFPYKDVTISHLLTHTAGLPKYFWVAEHKWEEKEPPSNAEMMALLETTDTPRFFRAGRNFDYSNTGYFVLASIVEKISGMAYADFVTYNIFQPLGMKNSFVYRYKKDTIRSNQLIGYRLYKGWRHLKIRGTVNDAIVGDKNVYATAEDLYKWHYGLLHGMLLSEDSVALMRTHGVTKYGRKVPYGMGFRLDYGENGRVYHYGKWNGFNTGLIQYPQEDLVIIILEHTSYKAIASLCRKIKKVVNYDFKS
jgi:CubicO group peptidase (beta-lactamase class C family)